MELHIITPVSRPDNLSKIWFNLRRVFSKITPIWYCGFDRGVAVPDQFPSDELGRLKIGFWGEAKKKSFYGNSIRNEILEIIDSGWVYFLDDDNLIHPDFEQVFLNSLQEYPEADWFIFDQVYLTGNIYLLAPPVPMINYIDTGQCVLKREIIGDIRFVENIYAADGYFYMELFQKAKPIPINVPATYYNALR